MDSIWVIGSINTDMVVTAKSLPRPGQTVIGDTFFINAGGKGANQAVAAARLGGNVSMVGNLGQDSFGDDAVMRLTREKVDCSHISRDNQQPSGVALINVDSTGENQITVVPGANQTLDRRQVKTAFESIKPGSLILLQLEIALPISSYAIMLAHARECRVILDPAPAQTLSRSTLQNLYLITPNESEAETLTRIKINSVQDAQKSAERILEYGVLNVALTMGKQGVLLANKQGIELVAAKAVIPIDTTAAGDCFNGSLAVALAQQKSLREAVLFACHAASISVTRMGAQDSMPSKLELDL